MKDWKNGSRCADCKAKRKPESGFTKAGTPAATKPGAGKKAGGSVTDEFPKCPSCGTPTADGTKCDDCRKSTDRDHQQGDLTVEQTREQLAQAREDAAEEAERRGVRAQARRKLAELLGFDVAKAAADLAELPPAVLKSAPSKRYSFAPMYMPGKLDAHDEFVKSADELQEAVWDYVRKTGGERTVFLQHIDKPAGEWVEMVSWPYAVEAPMVIPGTDRIRKASLPAGTVYMGVVWEPWAYELVRKGRLLGFSMGGWAKRVQAELADETVTKAVAGEPWTQAGVVNPNHRGAVREQLPPAASF